MLGCTDKRLAVWLALGALLAACSGQATGGQSTGDPSDTGGGGDTTLTDSGKDSDTSSVTDTQVGTDADSADAKPTDGTDGVDGGSELPDTDTGGADCPGGAFCSCKSDTDCDSGKCLETPDGLQCAAPCVDAGCPAGFACKAFGIGGDVVNYCVASHLSLCAPCNANKDCQTQGVTDALCLDYGAAGHFCGGTCQKDSDCGTGYTCNAASQCEASTGICGCSAWAKAAGTTTTCSNSNAAGTCNGTRLCDASGLTACSAKTPASETCNNLDDDCSGSADDLPSDATCANSAWSSSGSATPCSSDSACVVAGESCDKAAGVCHTLIGICKGQHVCVGGADVCQGAKTPKLEVCNGDDDNCDGQTDEGFTWNGLALGSTCGAGACAGGTVVCGSFTAATCVSPVAGSAETCNGVDDNCDGTTDEGTCNDGNPCTADVCDGAACQHPSVTSTCDDGNPCTLADACTGTTCTGTATPCDDGNPCTADTCDPKTGACVFANQPGSCSDGSACTSGDTCGTIPGGGWGCLAGAIGSCDDANPCTDDSCDPASGCVYVGNSYSTTCYDGPPSTVGVGPCHGGTRACEAGVLSTTCSDEVLPSAELCNGIDDSCNGITDEGCKAATVTLSFAAAQVTGKSGAMSVSVQLAPDRPAKTLQTQGAPQQMALGVLAWFIRLVTGK